MASQHAATLVEPPHRGGRFVAAQAALWMLAAPILGAAVARVAVWAEGFWAPLLVFPLLVGGGLGLLLFGVMRLGQVGHRATLATGAVLAVAAAVGGEHYFSFLDFRAAIIARRPAELPLADFQEVMPASSGNFVRFMERQAASGRPVTAKLHLRGAAAWASWAVDGLLMLAAALAVVGLGWQTPYCSCLPELVSTGSRRAACRRDGPAGGGSGVAADRGTAWSGPILPVALPERLWTEPVGIGLHRAGENAGRRGVAFGCPARASGAALDGESRL